MNSTFGSFKWNLSVKTIWGIEKNSKRQILSHFYCTHFYQKINFHPVFIKIKWNTAPLPLTVKYNNIIKNLLEWTKKIVLSGRLKRFESLILTLGYWLQHLQTQANQFIPPFGLQADSNFMSIPYERPLHLYSCERGKIQDLQ